MVKLFDNHPNIRQLHKQGYDVIMKQEIQPYGGKTKYELELIGWPMETKTLRGWMVKRK